MAVFYDVVVGTGREVRYQLSDDGGQTWQTPGTRTGATETSGETTGPVFNPNTGEGFQVSVDPGLQVSAQAANDGYYRVRRGVSTGEDGDELAELTGAAAVSNAWERNGDAIAALGEPGSAGRTRPRGNPGIQLVTGAVFTQPQPGSYRLTVALEFQAVVDFACT